MHRERARRDWRFAIVTRPRCARKKHQSTTPRGLRSSSSHHIIQYSSLHVSLTLYSSRGQQQPLISHHPSLHHLQHTRCRAIYLCICICIYCLFIFTAVVSSLAAPILDNVTLKAGPRPGPCRSRPIGLSRSCRWRKNTVFIICLA